MTTQVNGGFKFKLHCLDPTCEVPTTNVERHEEHEDVFSESNAMVIALPVKWYLLFQPCKHTYYPGPGETLQVIQDRATKEVRWA